MQTQPQVQPKAMRQGWERLHTSGTASPQIASLLRVNLDGYLQAFEQRFLGPDGIGEGFKLILGANGEGKTHLLYCLRDVALRCGHAVAYVDASKSGLGASPFTFAQKLLESVFIPGVDDEAAGENRVVTLFADAIRRKRESIAKQGLDEEKILPRWAESMRAKDLHPHGLADALADGLQAAVRDDVRAMLEAASRLTFQDHGFSQKAQLVEGANLLHSLPKLVGFVELRPLVILVDEAETVVEKRGASKRRE